MSKLIVANWKSNKTAVEAQQWLDQFKQVTVPNGILVVIAPSFPLLPIVHSAVQSMPNVTVGIQTISPYPAGSYTGAVSAVNVQGLGVTYAIVGHSEQRRYFELTSNMVARQIDQCLINGITPIVCVATQYLAEQTQAIANEYLEKCVVAYEPIESIGTGDNASLEEVVEVSNRIKVLFGNVPVIYGGSVTSALDNAYSAVVDGVLIGGASLDVAEFMKLVTT